MNETKRLAIEQLERVSKNLGAIGETVDYTELAIEALEQEPCEDVISRQAVLDYIYNDLGLGDEEYGKDVERQMELEISYRYIKSLPSINLEQKIGVGHQIKHKLKDEDFNKDFIFYECSCCSDVLDFRCNYCPNCGVKFEGERNKNEISN